MFNSLQDKLDKALQNLQGRGKITEINVAETVKEIRRALVDADVNYKVAKDLTKRVQDKALGENVLTSITPGQLMTKIVHDELVDLMGGTQEGINLSANPTIILIAGLQGSGKTTFSGKLANYLKSKRAKKPLLVACDVYRPAAIDQLTVLADQVGVTIYKEIENKNPVEISENAIKFAKENKHDVVIIDTAGRLAIDEAMMNEIRKVHLAVKPTETLFVVDAMTGQDAVNTALAFMEQHLGTHRWFAGEHLTMADFQMSFAVEAALSRASKAGACPNLLAYKQRMEARPAYQRGIAKGGPVVMST